MSHLIRQVKRVGHEAPVTVYGSFVIIASGIVIVPLALVFGS